MLECPGQSGGAVIPSDVLKMCLESSNFNWFDCIHQLESQFSFGTTTKLTETILHQLPDLKLSKQQEQLVLLSFQAFIAAKNDHERVARMVNGDTVTDSESGDPEDYCGLKNVLSETGRKLITKRRASIKRRAQRERAKAIAEQRFISSNVIIRDCPGIGKTIEKFVEDRCVGADAWRRTGVLTFDGNTRLKEKVTYERIRQHLQTVYN